MTIENRDSTGNINIVLSDQIQVTNQPYYHHLSVACAYSLYRITKSAQGHLHHSSDKRDNYYLEKNDNIQYHYEEPDQFFRLCHLGF